MGKLLCKICDFVAIMQSVSERAHLVSAYNFDLCELIFVIFGRHMLQEICNKEIYN